MDYTNNDDEFDIPHRFNISYSARFIAQQNEQRVLAEQTTGIIRAKILNNLIGKDTISCINICELNSKTPSRIKFRGSVDITIYLNEQHDDLIKAVEATRLIEDVLSIPNESLRSHLTGVITQSYAIKVTNTFACHLLNILYMNNIEKIAIFKSCQDITSIPNLDEAQARIILQGNRYRASVLNKAMNTNFAKHLYSICISHDPSDIPSFFCNIKLDKKYKSLDEVNCAVQLITNKIFASCESKEKIEIMPTGLLGFQYAIIIPESLTKLLIEYLSNSALAIGI